MKSSNNTGDTHIITAKWTQPNYQTCIKPLSNIFRQAIEHLSNIYRAPIKHRIYQKSIEHDETHRHEHNIQTPYDHNNVPSIEHLSKLYRTSIENLSNIYWHSINHL